MNVIYIFKNMNMVIVAMYIESMKDLKNEDIWLIFESIIV